MRYSSPGPVGRMHSSEAGAGFRRWGGGAGRILPGRLLVQCPLCFLPHPARVRWRGSRWPSPPPCSLPRGVTGPPAAWNTMAALSLCGRRQPGRATRLRGPRAGAFNPADCSSSPQGAGRQPPKPRGPGRRAHLPADSPRASGDDPVARRDTGHSAPKRAARSPGVVVRARGGEFLFFRYGRP